MVSVNGIVPAQLNIGRDALIKIIAPVLNDLYIYTAKQQRRFIRPVLETEKKSELSDFVQWVQEYFKDYVLEMATNITDTTIKKVHDILDQAIAGGWSVQRTVDALNDTELARSRARTIVRTESVRAMNFANQAISESEDFETTKEWIAIEDKRTRRAHTHVGVDGEKRDMNQKFSNGLMFPGDPEGAANQTINCRCTMAIRAKRDANGNIIMK
jgi:hypothetical protein